MSKLQITRRDFINGVLAGSGASLLARSGAVWPATSPFSEPAPGWYGYGGIGDYASSHGNTPEVVARAHELRDGRFARTTAAIDTGEVFDMVIVGGGMAGLGAGFEFTNRRRGTQTCLILENHPIFGGESKRNEFLVNGEHLIAPQGANGFSLPGVDEGEHASADARYYDAIGIPRDFTYQVWGGSGKPVNCGTDNFGFLYWLEHTANVGYFFDTPAVADGMFMVRDPWRHNLDDTPYAPEQRQQLLAWRFGRDKPHTGDDYQRWLDTMTYKHYVEKIMGLGEHISELANPVLAGAVGLGGDVLSAYAAYAILFPGVSSFYPPEVVNFENFARHSFPGGNDGFARHFIKKIMPHAIAGDTSFAAILNGKVNFDKLDKAGNPVRIRLAATVVGVEHDTDAARSEYVNVTYHRGGRLYRIRAKGVVMAAGGWITKHVVRDLPGSHRQAFNSFKHAPFLVANVALTNWRFLYDQGISACRYRGRFGYSCNLRLPMTVGDYRPPHDPDKPAVLTFYVPFIYPGHAAATQCIKGRTELFTTSYADYEMQIIGQLETLFGSRFQAHRDVAGIILNRWGHAYVVPEPGFYFGRNGRPAPRDVIRRPFGRIAFGHSELRGNQHWGPAAAEGGRAMIQVLETIG